MAQSFVPVSYVGIHRQAGIEQFAGIIDDGHLLLLQAAGIYPNPNMSWTQDHILQTTTELEDAFAAQIQDPFRQFRGCLMFIASEIPDGRLNINLLEDVDQSSAYIERLQRVSPSYARSAWAYLWSQVIGRTSSQSSLSATTAIARVLLSGCTLDEKLQEGEPRKLTLEILGKGKPDESWAAIDQMTTSAIFMILLRRFHLIKDAGKVHEALDTLKVMMHPVFARMQGGDNEQLARAIASCGLQDDTFFEVAQLLAPKEGAEIRIINCLPELISALILRGMTTTGEDAVDVCPPTAVLEELVHALARVSSSRADPAMSQWLGRRSCKSVINKAGKMPKDLPAMMCSLVGTSMGFLQQVDRALHGCQVQGHTAMAAVEQLENEREEAAEKLKLLYRLTSELARGSPGQFSVQQHEWLAKSGMDLAQSLPELEREDFRARASEFASHLKQTAGSGQS